MAIWLIISSLEKPQRIPSHPKTNPALSTAYTVAERAFEAFQYALCKKTVTTMGIYREGYQAPGARQA